MLRLHLLLLLLVTGAAQAADRTTTHMIALPAGPLAFTATIETMRLANPQGAPQAEIVTAAYTVDAPGRPVLFALNGGPGASSAWLQIGALGPWRVPLANPVVPSQDPSPVDNAETWLTFADLVFIDPPGTGYSRALGADDAQRQFQSVDADIQMLATVIRRWLEAHGRFGAPVFIAGESYGGFRGPRLARALLERQGVGVSGLVLISPVLDFNGRDAPYDPLRWVARLPSLVAAARGATTREAVQDAEAYAAGGYLADLVRGPADAAATARMVARVAQLTGLDPALVARRQGRIDLDAALRDRTPGQVASPYDAMIAAPDPFPEAPHDNSPDPVLDGLRGPVTASVLTLYRTKLDWQPEGAPARQYQLLNGQVARDWDYGRGQARPESMTALRQYLALDPTVHVLVQHGLTDLVTPYFASKLLLDQVSPPSPPDRLQLRTYPGGHMAYTRADSRAAMQADAAALVSRALAARRAATGTPPTAAPPPSAPGTPDPPASR